MHYKATAKPCMVLLKSARDLSGRERERETERQAEKQRDTKTHKDKQRQTQTNKRITH